MIDRLNNVELLIMLSDDVCAQGDELSGEMFVRGRAHVLRFRELSAMLDKARRLLDKAAAVQSVPPARQTRRLDTASGVNAAGCD